jgi:hypothetical protein
MAIGSEPEVGTTFKLFKDKTQEERQAFWDFMKENWNPLMKGYATLIHNKDNPYYRGRDVK